MYLFWQGRGSGLRFHLEAIASGSPAIVDANIVLVVVGKTPFTKGLGLQEFGVKVDKFVCGSWSSFLSHFKTNVDGTYAIGDVIPRHVLAHKAKEDGVTRVELRVGKVGHVKLWQCTWSGLHTSWGGQCKKHCGADEMLIKHIPRASRMCTTLKDYVCLMYEIKNPIIIISPFVLSHDHVTRATKFSIVMHPCQHCGTP